MFNLLIIIAFTALLAGQVGCLSPDENKQFLIIFFFFRCCLLTGVLWHATPFSIRYPSLFSLLSLGTVSCSTTRRQSCSLFT